MTAPSAVLLILVVLSSCEVVLSIVVMVEVVVGDSLSIVVMVEVVVGDSLSIVVMVKVVVGVDTLSAEVMDLIVPVSLSLVTVGVGGCVAVTV